MALDHVGWYRSLWFPSVMRETLNFPEAASDNEVHISLFRLIEAGAIEVGRGVGERFERVDAPIPVIVEDIQLNCESQYELRLSPDALERLHAAVKGSRVAQHFEILVHGYSFDVDTYLKSSPLRFDTVWHRGEGCYETNGVAIRLGNGVVTSLEDQERIAIEFLFRNRDPLKSLAAFSGADWRFLDLQYDVPRDEFWAGCCLHLSPKLMWHALDVGLTPRFHVAPDDFGYGFSRDLFLAGW